MRGLAIQSYPFKEATFPIQTLVMQVIKSNMPRSTIVVQSHESFKK